MADRSRRRRILQAIAGIAIGCILLWLATRQTTLDEFQSTLLSMNLKWALIALALYAAELMLRALRWRVLLARLGSVAYRTVTEVLLVGYAVNNVLPARLGELFRADYAKRRTGLSRSSTLASIMVERMMDLLFVIMWLVLGLITADMVGASRSISTLWQVLAVGAGILALAIVTLVILRRAPIPEAWLRRPVLARRLRDAKAGLGTITGHSGLATLALSAPIWILNASVIACVLLSVNVTLEVPAILVMTGVVSLSTIVPSAPAYLGSYQLAYAITLSAFGHATTQGLVAATVAQIFLFGTATAVGLGLYFARQTRSLSKDLKNL